MAKIARLALVPFGGLALLAPAAGGWNVVLPAVIGLVVAFAASLGAADLLTRDRICVLSRQREVVFFQDFHECHISFDDLEPYTLDTGTRTQLVGPDTTMTIKALNTYRGGEFDNTHLGLPPPLSEYDGPLLPWRRRSVSDLFRLIGSSLIPGRSTWPTLSLPRHRQR